MRQSPKRMSIRREHDMGDMPFVLENDKRIRFLSLVFGHWGIRLFLKVTVSGWVYRSARQVLVNRSLSSTNPWRQNGLPTTMTTLS